MSKGVMFLLLPLYTRVLQPADYGKLELVYLVGSILSILYGLNIENGYNRIFFYHKDEQYRKKLFATGQIFNLFCSLLFAVIILLNVNWVAKEIFNFGEGVLFLQLIVIITILEVMKHIPFNNIRIRKQAKKYVSVSLINLILITSLTVYFVAIVKLGVKGVLYAKILGDIFTLSVLYFITRKEYRVGFSYNQLKLMHGFSIFIIPASLSALILSMSNRYFLQEFQSLDDVGLYSLGAKLAGIIPFLFTEPVKKAFSPHLFELIDNPERCKKTLADFSRIFFAGLSIVALLISLFSKEVIMIMSDQSYAASYDIVFILSLSYLLHGLSGIVVLGIHITRKTWIITIIWPISAAANVALNIWLIPIYGRMGAAFATLLSVLIINSLYLFATHQVYPVPFEYMKLFIVLLVMFCANYLGTLIEGPFFIVIALKLVLMVSFLVFIYYSGIIKKSELANAHEFVLKKFKLVKKNND